MPMTSQQPKPEPKPIAPGSLENKFHLSRDAPLDKRMKRRHLAVYNFILDWYHSKYGDALASVRHITATLNERAPFGDTLYEGDIHRALADLVTWGYLEQDKGAGRRASRYVPVWEFPSVREIPNTTDQDRSVSISPNTGVSVFPNTTDVCIRESPNEDPSTPTRAQDPGTEKMDKDCPAPTAPVTAPLGAGRDADAGQEEKQTTSLPFGDKVAPFEALWRAYDHKQRRVDARVAYDKIAPGAELHETMIAAATKWRQHWARQNDPEAPRKTLGSWLRSEGFLEDPPTAYKAKERKAKPAKPVPTASNDNVEQFADWDVGAFSPFGTFTGTIVESKVIEVAGDDTDVILGFDTTGNGTADIHHTIHLQNRNQQKQERGQRFFAQISKFADMYSVEGTEELHGTEATFTIDNRGQITYHGGRPGPDAKPQPPEPALPPRPINTSAAPWRSGS